jgi:hypothetical protein
MPAVETSEIVVFIIGNVVLVECSVVRVFQLDILQPFVRRNKTISDHLNLWLMGNSLEIRVKDAPFSVKSLAVAIVVRCGVKALCELVLCFWGEFVLVLEQDDVMMIQRITDGRKLLVY